MILDDIFKFKTYTHTLLEVIFDCNDLYPKYKWSILLFSIFELLHIILVERFNNKNLSS